MDREEPVVGKPKNPNKFTWTAPLKLTETDPNPNLNWGSGLTERSMSKISKKFPGPNAELGPKPN